MQRASDWHFDADQPLALRIDGDLSPATGPLVTESFLLGVLALLGPQADDFRSGRRHSLDARYSTPETGLRLHFFRAGGRVHLSARSIAHHIPTLEDLRLPRGFIDLIQAPPPNGVILVAGSTGSGKSTTLAAVLHQINQREPGVIITIEDPIEFQHGNLRCRVKQREVGRDVASFGDGVRDALRQDPDYILVGEMRDLETVSRGLSAGETGHLVFSTLHTRNCAQTIDRILEIVPESDRPQYRAMLASSLKAVLCQRLLKRRDGGGRIAAYEYMHVTPAIQNKIREGKINQIASDIQMGVQYGSQLFETSLLELYRSGLITKEVALASADDPEALRRKF